MHWYSQRDRLANDNGCYRWGNRNTSRCLRYLSVWSNIRESVHAVTIIVGEEYTLIISLARADHHSNRSDEKTGGIIAPKDLFIVRRISILVQIHEQNHSTLRWRSKIDTLSIAAHNYKITTEPVPATMRRYYSHTTLLVRDSITIVEYYI